MAKSSSDATVNREATDNVSSEELTTFPGEPPHEKFTTNYKLS